MNVAVINLKDITRYVIKIVFVTFLIYITSQYISKSGQSIRQIITNEASNTFLTRCLKISIPALNNIEEEEQKSIKITKLINMELAMLSPDIVETRAEVVQTPEQIEQDVSKQEETTLSPEVEISKNAQTNKVTEKNFEAGYNLLLKTTQIDNESSYTITEEMLTTDVDIGNKKDVIIFHTHTCESYTPCETYNYTMTGNYRTTDSNYNVIRVGTELSNCLTNKGFNVIHDGTYHDYPSYSGAYSRSLETVKRLLEDTKAEIVIDIHRDAVGNGDTYGPTVMVDGQKVAQLMFVIGTDGGGSEHPNWIENLKIAIKIQEKANEMYPGLFRPIIVRNSRYNQHIAKGACIIEVGATANTLGECLLSMQCLANIMEEVCK